MPREENGKAHVQRPAIERKGPCLIKTKMDMQSALKFHGQGAKQSGADP